MKLGKSNIVISLSREKVAIHKVEVRTSKTTELFTASWSIESLEKVITSMAAAVSAREIRLLLEEDLAYVVAGDVPEFNKEKSKREQIREIIRQEVPEEVSDEDWDYKLLGKKQKKQFQAFVPVLDLYKPFVEAMTAADFSIEVVEPAVLAKKRHENPVVGIVLKDDEKGKDENVLTLEVDTENVKKKRLESVVRIGMLSSVLVGILIATLVTIFMLSQQNQKKEQIEVPLVSEAQQEESGNEAESNLEDQTSIEVTEEAVVVVDADELEIEELTLQVQNGSGQAGVAGLIAEQLEVAGFENIETANADAFDYENVSVYFKGNLSEQNSILSLIEEALSEYTVIQSGNLEEDDSYDVVVIVGSE